MEGKKSFVLYTDLVHTVRKLPKDKQADLFMMILEYVNDENPQTDDLLLEVAFEPIKRQLKRDLIKYEERAKRSRINGKSGGRPPKEKPRKPSGLNENPEEPRKPDNVNVNVNDNVNVDKSICTVSDAYSLFDKQGLSGRYFSKMNTVHGLNEKVIQEEFLKWKQVNDGQNFQNEKHLQNSFNNWLRNYKPPRAGTTDATISVLPMNNRKSRNPQ